MGSERLDSPRFFVLEPASGSSHDTTFDRLGHTLGEAPRCPHCGAFIGMREWLPPLRGTMKLYGTAFGDLVSGPSCGFLLSERFVEALHSEGLTGLPQFQPVEVVRRVRQPQRANPPAYFYAQPSFGGAAVSESTSRLRRSEPITCEWCRETGVDTIHGFHLESGSWTGADVFFARGLPGTAIASERFARFVAQHGLTNIRLTPTEVYVRDPLELGPEHTPDTSIE